MTYYHKKWAVARRQNKHRFKKIDDNPNQAQEYRGGKEKLLTFFVGQTMKATRGKANPKQVNALIKEKLA